MVNSMVKEYIEVMIKLKKKEFGKMVRESNGFDIFIKFSESFYTCLIDKIIFMFIIFKIKSIKNLKKISKCFSI